MQLDKASSYALWATACIARQASGRAVQGRIVASLCEFPFDYLLKILQQLTHHGILVSERGRTGGFRLARPPEKITVLNVVEAMHGPVRGQVRGRGHKRPNQSERLLQDACQEIAEHARERLSRLTIAELARPPRAVPLRALPY